MAKIFLKLRGDVVNIGLWVLSTVIKFGNRNPILPKLLKFTITPERTLTYSVHLRASAKRTVLLWSYRHSLGWSNL